MKKFKELMKKRKEKNKDKVCKYCNTTENADNLCGVYKCWI